jgi:hypothetical protein
MTLRLAHRLAAVDLMPPHPSSLPLGVDRGILKERMRLEAEFAAGAVHLSLDNVAQFYADHDRDVWDMHDHIPNWSPPWSHFFAEWNEPKTWTLNGERCQRRDFEFSQVGLHCLSCDVTDANRGDRAGWADFLSRFAGGPLDVVHLETLLFAHLPAARWVLACSVWQSVSLRPCCGRPLWLGLAHFLVIDRRGRLLRHFTSGACANFLRDPDGSLPDAVFSPLHILGLGLSFCHCKNVRQVERTADEGERWHRRTRVPRLRYRVLDIDPMREVLRREGDSENTGLQRALHICRGHFATYTDNFMGRPLDKPMTVWRPAHVRGSLDEGIVVSDYNVKAPANP